MRDEAVRAGILENEVEARLVELELRERGIPHAVHSYHDAAYDGLFQFQKGWGHVVGPASRLAEIRQILRDMRATILPENGDG